MKFLQKVEATYRIVAETPDERAYRRLVGFMAKAKGSESKLAQLVNLRTDRTTNPEKLNAWIKVLKQSGLPKLAQYAQSKMRGMQQAA